MAMDYVGLAAAAAAATGAIAAGLGSAALASRTAKRIGTETERVLKSIPPGTPPAEKEQRLRTEIAGHSLAQAKATFIISLAAAIVGFLFILVGLGAVIYTLLGGARGPEPGYLVGQTGGLGAASTLSGIITEAVAVLFFAQTNKTREVLLQTFDRLREDRKLDEALWFLKDQESALGDEARQRVATFVTLYFAGLQPKDSQGFFGGLTEVTAAATKEDPNGSRQSGAPASRRRQRRSPPRAAGVDISNQDEASPSPP